jgi:hypothetical protein
MNSLKSAFRNYGRFAGVVLLFLAALSGGIGSARATDLGNGQVVYSTIAGSSNTTYTFTATSGSYMISIWESGGHSTTSNAAFQITKPGGTKTGTWADTNYDTGFNIAIGTFTGQYTVTVFNYQASTTAAAYGLEVALVPGTVGVPNGQTGGALQPSMSNSDSVSIGAFDVWAFQGIASNTFSVALTKSSGGAGFCPFMQIFTPTGTSVGTNTSCTTTSRSATAVAGTYYVYVSNDYLGNGTGSYSLEVTGNGAGMSGQGNGDGATCLTCAAKQQGPSPQSAEVTAIGAVSTPPSPK